MDSCCFLTADVFQKKHGCKIFRNLKSKKPNNYFFLTRVTFAFDFVETADSSCLLKLKAKVKKSMFHTNFSDVFLLSF